MKLLILPLFFLSYCSLSQTAHGQKYSVEIWDYNFSMAYTTVYYIDNDSLIIRNVSEVKNEGDSFLVKRKIDSGESKKVYNFLRALNISGLKAKYDNPLVEDGDRKKVIIKVGSKIKEIEISNVYEKGMAHLFDIINRIIGGKFKIGYKTS